VTDPWDEFVRRTEGAELAGYFERAAGHSSRNGIAAWFDRGELLPPLTPHSDLREVARRTARHTRRGAGSVAFGYLGFDAVGLFEPALPRFPTGAPFPLGEIVLADRASIRPVGPRRTRGTGPTRESPNGPRADSLPRRRFIAAVGRLRRAIRDGEAFQVVLSHRRTWARPSDLLARAGRLRASERFAYFYYLRLGDRELLGASPESVVELDGRWARVNPIAGTLPYRRGRGRVPLRRDPKELAEHRMLVDLARNDLGRVAAPGSVRVAWKERRVRYARVEHLVSRVAGRVRPGTGPWDVLRATFPAGTVSGAPKIRATEWLRREERTWRGPYAGAVGMIGPGDRADWALAIRGGFAAGNALYTAAGAGIVFGSRGDREYDETLAKLAHVETTLVGGAP
jgi:anthranilate/para-aminobenzoate synthase component I